MSQAQKPDTGGTRRGDSCCNGEMACGVSGEVIWKKIKEEYLMVWYLNIPTYLWSPNLNWNQKVILACRFQLLLPNTGTRFVILYVLMKIRREGIKLHQTVGYFHRPSTIASGIRSDLLYIGGEYLTKSNRIDHKALATRVTLKLALGGHPSPCLFFPSKKLRKSHG